jgi:hypothetical protein
VSLADVEREPFHLHEDKTHAMMDLAYDRVVETRRADDEEHDGLVRVRDLRECVGARGRGEAAAG